MTSLDFQKAATKLVATRTTLRAFGNPIASQKCKFRYKRQAKYCPTCLSTEIQDKHRDPWDESSCDADSDKEGDKEEEEGEEEWADDNDDGEDGGNPQGGNKSKMRLKKTMSVKNKFRSFKKVAKTVIQSQSVITGVEHTITRNKVVVASNNKTLHKVPVVGGEPISEELAKELRRRIFGSCELIGSSLGEWLGLPYTFHEVQDSKASYLLKAPKTSTKGFLMCVQGYILKYVLFNRTVKSRARPSSSSEKAAADRAERARKVLMQQFLTTLPTFPDVGECYRVKMGSNRLATKSQEESLAVALSDVLWKVGDQKAATLCLTSDDIYVNASDSFQVDGCTERMQIFHFQRQEDLFNCIKKYLFEFFCERGHGLLLSLYSLLLTRGLERLKEDMDGDDESTYIQLSGDISPCIANLMITGRASKYTHNGITYESGDYSMSEAQTGILTRSEMGLLVWCRSDGGNNADAVGSRLKTPSLPIWITRCMSSSYGILFSPNRDLLRNYHAENKFDLHYYCSGTQQIPTMITINTRQMEAPDEYNAPPLSNLIRTKWVDAEIDWNDTPPFY